MDPTANLQEQLELAREIQGFTFDHGSFDDMAEAADRAERLADLVLALHDWIRLGGFLPDGWAIAQKRAKQLDAESKVR